MRYSIGSLICAISVCCCLSWAETSQDFHRKGEEAYKAKDYVRAVEYYTEALKIQPERHETIYARGVNYYKLKRYDEALADFNRVKDVKKIDHHALNYIGLICNDKREYRGALNAFMGAVNLEPKSVVYCLDAARAAVQANSPANAIAYYKKALKIDPTNKEAHKYINTRKTAIAGMDNSEEELRVAAEVEAERRKNRSTRPMIGCLELRNLIVSELQSPDSFVATLRAYSASERGECKDIKGIWYCLECEDSGVPKLLQVQKDTEGVMHFRGYGCHCSEE